jgi:hypothetical protein
MEILYFVTPIRKLFRLWRISQTPLSPLSPVIRGNFNCPGSPCTARLTSKFLTTKFRN